jgi:glycosyltransferase involved in cell wall biosynthesis
VGQAPELEGITVVAVTPPMELYAGGRRRVFPPVLFGLGVLRHLLRHGRRYDIVHTASFPYFSLLAAGAARPAARYRLVVDWHEVWSREYWRSYLGTFGGEIGWRIQALCMRVPQTAFCFSRLHAERLRRGGVEPTLLEGEYAGEATAPVPLPAKPRVVFAGRHIPEKRVLALPPAMRRVRQEVPGLRCVIYGDGPEREKLLQAIADGGLEDAVSAPGFVDAEQIAHAIGNALCLVLPSSREGYGLVVVEAAAAATPSVVVAGPDNAAAELVEDGENGFVASSASPEDLARAIARVHRGGQALRESTAAWFARNAERLSLETSLRTVMRVYIDGDAR